MEKAKVFGKNVTVCLSTIEGSTPIIIDFDSISINSNAQAVRYNGIGKTIPQAQEIYGGYTVTLSRKKTDNAMVSFNIILDNFIKNNLNTFEFAVKQKTVYPMKRIDKAMILANHHKDESLLDAITGRFGGIVQSIGKDVARTVANSPLGGFVNNVKNGISQAFDPLTQLSKKIGTFFTNTQYFEESIIFIGATRTGFNTSSSADTETTESMTFYCQEMLMYNPLSQDYSDQFLPNIAEKHYNRQYIENKPNTLLQKAIDVI